MSDDERKRKLDEIREISDRLTELARRFDRLRWMAEKDASTAFLRLAEAAGQMTEASLAQLATLLDLLFQAQMKAEGKA
jgi:hypothetical protein